MLSRVRKVSVANTKTNSRSSWVALPHDAYRAMTPSTALASRLKTPFRGGTFARASRKAKAKEIKAPDHLVPSIPRK